MTASVNKQDFDENTVVSFLPLTLKAAAAYSSRGGFFFQHFFFKFLMSAPFSSRKVRGARALEIGSFGHPPNTFGKVTWICATPVGIFLQNMNMSQPISCGEVAI